jgi:hypothetical protein
MLLLHLARAEIRYTMSLSVQNPPTRLAIFEIIRVAATSRRSPGGIVVAFRMRPVLHDELALSVTQTGLITEIEVWKARMRK